jgi:ZIP family zinc transporter
MVAASIWSLLIPAMNQCADSGRWAFIPAFIGFWLGILFLLLLDKIIPHLHMNAQQTEGLKSKAKKTTMMVLAVTLHNIPEGMAVGVVYAGLLSGSAEITAGGARSCYRYSDTELPGGCDHFNAAPRGRQNERQSVSRRSAFRRG